MRFIVITERTPGKLTAVTIIDKDTQKPVEVEGYSLPRFYVADNKVAVTMGLILTELLESHDSQQ